MDLDVAIIGCGRVGLPLALAFADHGLKVIGVDKAPDRLDAVQAGRMPFAEPRAQEALERVDVTWTDDVTDAVVADINASGADIVWVGIGVPKQEKWMRALRSRLDAPVLVGVGAAFDFHAGLVAQAPGWMQSAGLEWAYRLAQEPRRLWRRYLVQDPAFVLIMLRMLRLAPSQRRRAITPFAARARAA